MGISVFAIWWQLWQTQIDLLTLLITIGTAKALPFTQQERQVPLWELASLIRIYVHDRMKTSPRQPCFWPEGMRCCALFGIAELSLDYLSRCAVAHLHYVHAGLQGIAAATVEVICLWFLNCSCSRQRLLRWRSRQPPRYWQNFSTGLPGCNHPLNPWELSVCREIYLRSQIQQPCR